MNTKVPSHNDICEQSQQLDSDFTDINTIAQECSFLMLKDGDNNYRNIYLQTEMKRISDTVFELREKLENLKNVLFMESYGDVDYESLTANLVKENQADREFMQMFGGYMMIHQMMQNEMN